MARWILLDLNNVVVHLFDPQTREFYELERLWGDAPQVPFDPATA
jgi:ribosome-associated protein